MRKQTLAISPYKYGGGGLSFINVVLFLHILINF